jgi:DNA topoisomerase-1
VVLVGAEKKKLLVTDIGILTSDFLDKNFKHIIDSGFTSNMELNLDDVVNGDKQWLQVMRDFYGPFKISLDNMHQQDAATLKNDRKRLLGKDGDDNNVYAYVGKFGPVVEWEKGGKSTFRSLTENLQVDSVTLEEVLNMEVFPKLLGDHHSKDVMLCKGRYGYYITYDGKNYKLLENMDKNMTLEDAIQCINSSENGTGKKILKKLGNYSIGNGQYGYYILFESKFYSLSQSVTIEKLTEENCKEIVAQGKKEKGNYTKRRCAK